MIGVPEGEDKEKAAEHLSKEVMVENFPNLGRYLNVQGHEANKSPPNFNSQQYLP